MEIFVSICSEIILNLFMSRRYYCFVWRELSIHISNSGNRTFFTNIFLDRSIERLLHPIRCKPSIILCPWEFLFVRNVGCRWNKITALGFGIQTRNIHVLTPRGPQEDVVLFIVKGTDIATPFKSDSWKPSPFPMDFEVP